SRTLFRTPPPRSTLFPYTTRFRSCQGHPVDARAEILPAGTSGNAIFKPDQDCGTAVGIEVHPQRGGREPADDGRDPNFERFDDQDRKSTRLNSSHVKISYAVFCLK